MILKPTNRLRWKEIDPYKIEEALMMPLATKPGYTKGIHYRLQQYWEPLRAGEGEWRDIEVH